MAQGAQSVAEILPEIFDPARAARVSAFLLHLFGTADGDSRFPVGGVASITACDQIFRVLIQVKMQFFLELLFQFSAVREAIEPIHSAPPSDISRMRPTAWVRRAQLLASVSSCARPLRVRL